jgi:hypothetical protein
MANPFVGHPGVWPCELSGNGPANGGRGESPGWSGAEPWEPTPSDDPAPTGRQDHPATLAGTIVGRHDGTETLLPPRWGGKALWGTVPGVPLALHPGLSPGPPWAGWAPWRQGHESRARGLLVSWHGGLLFWGMPASPWRPQGATPSGCLCWMVLFVRGWRPWCATLNGGVCHHPSRVVRRFRCSGVGIVAKMPYYHCFYSEFPS